MKFKCTECSGRGFHERYEGAVLVEETKCQWCTSGRMNQQQALVYGMHLGESSIRDRSTWDAVTRLVRVLRDYDPASLDAIFEQKMGHLLDDIVPEGDF